MQDSHTPSQILHPSSNVSSNPYALLITDVIPDHLGSPSLLRGLNSRDVQLVREAGIPLYFKKGSRIFTQGTAHDGIFLIETGRIRVFYVSPSDREITLAYWYPESFVGAPEVFKRGVHVWSGDATMNSTILHLPGDVVHRLISEIPALALGIIEGLSYKGRCYSAMAQMLGTRSATERLAHLLLHLVSLYGVDERGGKLIAASLTHAEIAHMIGATRQWITISLKRLTERGILRTHGPNLVIDDMIALEQIRDGRATPDQKIS